MKPLVVAVLGPTATGKSALALAIAERHDGEIINCDSTAVYRGFDIGTDKIADADRRGIPHHLIDIVEPTDEYTAAQFARDAAAVIRDIHARGRLPILAGGTGFYFRALTRGLFPGPGKDAALRARLELASTAAAHLGTDHLDLVVLNSAPLSLAGRILQTRRVLVDRDPFLRHRYESLTARMFHDFRIREHRILSHRFARG